MEGHNSRFSCLQFDQAIEFIITLIANGGKLEGTSVSFDASNVSDAGSIAAGKGTTQAVLEAIIKNAISKVEFIEGESKFRITRLDGTHRDIEISIPSSAADVTYQNNTEQTSATNVQSAITDLFTKIENIKPIGGSGVTPEQIKEAVQEWLSAHPEATIPDGSVTFDKFANEVKNRPVLNVRGDDYSNGVPEFLLGTGGGNNILDVLGNGGIKVITSTVGGRKAIVIDATGVKAGLTDEDRNKLNKIDGLETSVLNAVQKTEDLSRKTDNLAKAIEEGVGTTDAVVLPIITDDADVQNAVSSAAVAQYVAENASQGGGVSSEAIDLLDAWMRSVVTEGNQDALRQQVIAELKKGGSFNPNYVARPTIEINDYKVTMSQADGCDIYYTIDGSTPTASSLKYTGGELSWNVDKTIKAIAVNANGKTSAIVEVEYVAAPVPYIIFEDAEAERICVENWGRADGKVYKDDLTSVASLGGKFAGDTTIERFNELKYFVGISILQSKDFANCTNLKAVTTPSSCKTMKGSLNNGVFLNCTNLEYLDISSVNDLQTTLQGCSKIKTIKFNDSLTSIPGSFCYNNDNISLTSLKLPSALAAIGESGLGGFKALASLELPSALATIGDAAFENLSSLTSLIVPDSVTSVGKNLIRGSGIKNLTLGTGVTYLPIAITRSAPIEEVHLRGAVTDIATYAFGYNSNYDIYFEGVTSVPTLGDSGLAGVRKIYVPSTLVETFKSTWTSLASKIEAL